MLDGILDQLKGQLGPELMEKFGLDEDKKEQAFSAAKDTLKNGVQKEASGGGLDGLLNMFSQGDNDEKGNAMQDKLGGDMVSQLAGKLGIDADKASGIKDMIMSQVTKMTGDKGGSFDMSSLMAMVTGGDDNGKSGGGASGAGGFLSKIMSMFGGKK